MSTDASAFENWSGTVTLTEIDGEVVLPIPEEVFDALGWDVGDTLEWTVQDGIARIEKITIFHHSV